MRSTAASTRELTTTTTTQHQAKSQRSGRERGTSVGVESKVYTPFGEPIAEHFNAGGVIEGRISPQGAVLYQYCLRNGKTLERVAGYDGEWSPWTERVAGGPLAAVFSLWRNVHEIEGASEHELLARAVVALETIAAHVKARP